MQTKTQTENGKQRFFSVELQTKTNLKNLILTSAPKENVLIEGTIGELTKATFTEGIMLEVIGTKGTLRIDIAEQEITPKQRQLTQSERIQ